MTETLLLALTPLTCLFVCTGPLLNQENWWCQHCLFANYVHQNRSSETDLEADEEEALNSHESLNGTRLLRKRRETWEIQNNGQEKYNEGHRQRNKKRKTI